MRSMTGYGYARINHPDEGLFEIELVSVNSRNLDISLVGNRKIFPGIYKRIITMVRKYIRRGNISIRYEFPEPSDIQINSALLNRYKKKLPDVPITDVLKLEGIVTYTENRKRRGKIFCSLLEKALKKLVNSREREGKTLKSALQCEIDAIRRYADKINAKECTEEKVRLLSHCKEMFRTLNLKRGPWGKHLNFLGQEILREANTITQKSLSSTLTRSALLVKERAENIREISRNLE